MDKNAFLDLIELLDEERRHNESLAFSSLDASYKAAFAVAAHRDAAAISDIRRKLASKPRAGKRLPTSKRQFDAYLDTLLDSCFERGRTRLDRGVLDRISRTPPGSKPRKTQPFPYRPL